MQFGIIGFPLGHSFSPAYFSEKFKILGLKNYKYSSFPLNHISELPQLLEHNPLISGLSVTIPFKEQVLDYLDVKSIEVEEIAACNCLKIYRKSNQIKIHGFNTDCIGFKKSLLNLIGDQRPNALILGSGGASKAAKFVLDSLDISSEIISRNISISKLIYDEVKEEIIFDNKLIINTTPLGMFPNVDSKPKLPYHALTKNHFLFDMVYNPTLTSFLQEGKSRGATIQNGLEMLHFQADAAWEIWNS